jgi:TonB family protein
MRFYLASLAALVVLSACASQRHREPVQPDPMGVTPLVNGYPEDMKLTTKQNGDTAINREGIRQTFINHNIDMQKCYTSALKENKGASGKVVVDFTIVEGGKVGEASVYGPKTTLTDEGMNKCLIDGIKKWKFPAPPKNQTVQVYYPLAFSPNK